MEYYYCGDCVYFRIDEDTEEGYCRQTYYDTYEYSSACDDIVLKDDDW